MRRSWTQSSCSNPQPCRAVVCSLGRLNVCPTTTQANFLLKPRTAEELLVFCRRHLGLEFPPDPPASPRSKTGDAGKGGGDAGEIRGASSNPPRSRNRNGPEVRSVRKEGSGSRKSVRRVRSLADDSTIAVDVARAVLAWGEPFRSAPRSRWTWRRQTCGGWKTCGTQKMID